MISHAILAHNRGRSKDLADTAATKAVDKRIN
jgi:hypothetical protein